MKRIYAAVISAVTFICCGGIFYQQRADIKTYEKKIQTLTNQVDSLEATTQQLEYQIARYDIALTQLLERYPVAGKRYMEVLKDVE